MPNMLDFETNLVSFILYLAQCSHVNRISANIVIFSLFFMEINIDTASSARSSYGSQLVCLLKILFRFSCAYVYVCFMRFI